MKSAQVTRILVPPPDGKKSVIWCPTPKVAPCLKIVTMSKSRVERAQEVARGGCHLKDLPSLAEMIALEVFGNLMVRVFSIASTWCGLSPGTVGSPSAGIGANHHAQSHKDL